MRCTAGRPIGSQYGSYLTVAQLEDICAPIGRPAVQRTTTYGRANAERQAAARHFDGLAKAAADATAPPGGGPTLLTLGRRV